MGNLWKVALTVVAGVVTLTGVCFAELGRVEREAAVLPPVTPLFARRLDEMAVQFGMAPAAVADALPAEAEGQRQMAPARQALLWPSEAASACALSGCIGSACVGSECVGSGCVGSTCIGSECTLSSCSNCNREGTPENNSPTAPDQTAPQTAPNQKSGAYCPLQNQNPLATVRITGFDVARVTAGNEIRFEVSGGDVAGYRVYRNAGAGRGDVLVAEGSASNDRLMRVIDPLPAGRDVTYTVQTTDTVGRVAEATSPAGSTQSAALQAPTKQLF
jgi:hypothetical protein